MKTKKFISGVFALTVICFSFSIASGEIVKKAISFPQDIDEQRVMEAAMRECKKLEYELQKVEGKTIFKKEFYMGQQGYEILIKLSVAPGENGQKVLSLDGESMGDQVITTWRGVSLDQDVKQIEKAVKKYLESK